MINTGPSLWIKLLGFACPPSGWGEWPVSLGRQPGGFGFPGPVMNHCLKASLGRWL